MVRHLEDFSTAPFPWFQPTPALSSIELMLHLLGIRKPYFQADSSDRPRHWSSLIGMTFDSVVLRRMEGTAEAQQLLLDNELKAGRPVGLVLKGPAGISGETDEQGWAVLRMNQIEHYIFLDTVRKHPESVQTVGRFTERRVLRFDRLDSEEISAMLYWEPLIAPIPFRRRGGRPRNHPPARRALRSGAA